MAATQSKIEDEHSRSPAAGTPGHGGTGIRRAVVTIAIVTLMRSEEHTSELQSHA